MAYLDNPNLFTIEKWTEFALGAISQAFQFLKEVNQEKPDYSQLEGLRQKIGSGQLEDSVVVYFKQTIENSLVQKQQRAQQLYHSSVATSRKMYGEDATKAAISVLNT